MQAVIERVMHTYGMIQPLSPEESDAIRQQVLEHLSAQTGKDDHGLAVEGLRFVRQIRSSHR